MLYVLMYEDAYDEGNYPVAVLDENGKLKVQKIFFELEREEYAERTEEKKLKLNKYLNKFAGYETYPDFAKKIKKLKEEYKKSKDILDNTKLKNESYCSPNKFEYRYGYYTIYSFEISGGEIGEEILKDGYTAEIGKNGHFVL